MDQSTMRLATLGTRWEASTDTLACMVDQGRAWFASTAPDATLYISRVYPDEEPVLLGLAARFPDHVVPLFTHDLHSGAVFNVGDLLATMRITPD